MPIVFQKDGSNLVGTLDCWTKKNPTGFRIGHQKISKVSYLIEYACNMVYQICLASSLKKDSNMRVRQSNLTKQN